MRLNDSLTDVNLSGYVVLAAHAAELADALGSNTSLTALKLTSTDANVTALLQGATSSTLALEIDSFRRQ